MNYIIREMGESEYAVLDDFLYEAIFIPEGVSSPSREIIYQPELQVYVDGFGTVNNLSYAVFHTTYWEEI